jgi:WD40 repeat protein
MRPHALLTLAFFLAAGPGLPAQELKERGAFTGHKFGVQRVALSPDGKVLAAGGGDTRGGELKLWDVEAGKELGPLPGYSDSLYALAFSSDGKLLASGDSSYRVTLWDVNDRKGVATFKVREYAHALSFSPDGKTLVVAGDREVKLWDVAARRELASFKRIVGVWATAFSRDLKTLASPNYQEIDLWDVAEGKERLVLSEHRGAVHCLAFSADGKTLAAASDFTVGEFQRQGQVKLWDVATGKERVTFPGQFGGAMGLALSPDGKTLALLEYRSLDADVELKVLDASTGRVRLTHQWPKRTSLFLAFTADGKLFVMGGSGENTVRLWEVVSPTEER